MMYLVLGAALGTVGGLFGIGGGLIAIPVLGVLFGLDQQLAQGTALVMVVPNVMLALWRYHQRNRIELRHALPLGVMGFSFAWSSKNTSAANASRNADFSRPPRNNDSSRRISHSRKVRITRSCDGAERAVTKAVRIGQASSGNSRCNKLSAAKNPLKGPPVPDRTRGGNPRAR
jgi:hypothetical protein